VLIDWSNARSGPPEADLAMTWILLATGAIEASAPVRAALGAVRSLLVRSFLGGCERGPVEAVLPVGAERRLADPNVTPAEAARVHALLHAVSGTR
jgi:hypothetical protein